MTELSPGTGANPDTTYTLSSGEAAKAGLRELREVAKDLAEALRALLAAEGYEEDHDRAATALARYEALRDG